MTEPYSNEPVEVAVPCNCPGGPHEGDIVYLTRHISMEGGLAIAAAVVQEATDAEMTMAVSLALIHHGILGWTFVSGTDAQGQPKAVPVNPATINRMLPFTRGGLEVSNRAAALYQEEVFGPLEKAVREQSKVSRTNGQTRPILTSHEKPRRPRSGSSSPRASAGKP